MQSKEHILHGRRSIPRERPSLLEGTGPKTKDREAIDKLLFIALGSQYVVDFTFVYFTIGAI
jgi:hypothetical protein